MKNIEKHFPSLSGNINVAFIGFGEAAMTFVKGWQKTDCPNIKVYDVKTDNPSATVRQEKIADYDNLTVMGCESLNIAVTEADVIFSLVTADQALIAAENTTNHIIKDTLYLDCNSCAPDTKRQAEKLISSKGGRYVDVAVMAPVQVNLNKIPLLLSGPHAGAALVVLESLNMSASIIAGDIGTASSVKMMRSIMIKGMEALMMECVLSACKAGVDDIVLESLEGSFPGFEWRERTAYMLERVMTHGVRRAAEMQEVALTIEQLGLDGKMTKATADWQQRVGALGIESNPSDKINYQILAEKVLQRLQEEKKI
ncbi:MAG: NAD(P)-dependent oxidoreductase [Alphaproteobacteria bacterium]|nr:NAD(P)-dependent oxidoreductase [Alphaproteobacteria bacterium]